MKEKKNIPAGKRILELVRNNAVPIMFIIICAVFIPMAGFSPSYLLNEIITRMGRNLFLVLCLLFPIMAGMGLNFAMTLGAMGAEIAVILVAEDSVLLSKMIEEALHKSGYVNTRMFPDGSKLWEFLNSLRDHDNLDDEVALIITDIEMPQMDGHRLTKLVKDDKDFRHLPLIIFSSLITEEMRRKGKELGADEQMSKPEIGHLVRVIDHLLEEGGRRE